MPPPSPTLMRPRPVRAHPATRLDNQASADPLPLLLQMLQATDTSAAARLVTRSLPPQLQSCSMALGLSGRHGASRLLAVTGRPQLDHRSERTRTLEAALDETIMSDGPLVSTRFGSNGPPAKTHEQLARALGSAWVASHPLRDGAGHSVGAWMLWGDTEHSLLAAQAWLSEAQQPIGTALQTIAQAHQGVAARLVENVRDKLRSSASRRVWKIATLTIAALLLLPLPYKISCECLLEPVTRRYIVAPFDATLAQTLVKPGDIVTAGQPLIELDERELQWELASLRAAHDKAQKQRDAAVADRQTSAGQLARLEMEELDHKIALLTHRQANLRISSPFDGVIISGDLQRVEGAAVKTGETLLEVAPLDKVIVEVAVPERDICSIREQATTQVRLDAFPGRTWTATINNIHPRAEIRGADQVFVAELEIANEDRELRPGMRGTAKVHSDWAPISWILFHRPYYALTRWLGW